MVSFNHLSESHSFYFFISDCRLKMAYVVEYLSDQEFGLVCVYMFSRFRIMPLYPQMNIRKCSYWSCVSYYTDGAHVTEL